MAVGLDVAQTNVVCVGINEICCIGLDPFISYPGVQGFSIRSIQRFCQEKNVHKTSRVTDQELDEAVSDAVSRVCSLLQYVKVLKFYIHFSVL